MLLRLTLNNRWCAASIAIETGSLHEAVDHRRATVAVFASTSTTSAIQKRKRRIARAISVIRNDRKRVDSDDKPAMPRWFDACDRRLRGSS